MIEAPSNAATWTARQGVGSHAVPLRRNAVHEERHETLKKVSAPTSEPSRPRAQSKKAA
jgi:hypothetical protein